MFRGHEVNGVDSEGGVHHAELTYQFIADNADTQPVRWLCKALDVSSPGTTPALHGWVARLGNGGTSFGGAIEAVHAELKPWSGASDACGTDREEPHGFGEHRGQAHERPLDSSQNAEPVRANDGREACVGSGRQRWTGTRCSGRLKRFTRC